MEKNKKKQVYNPYLPLYEYVPDGEPHVFGDRLYVYGSHDRFDGEMFCLNDYICYSAPLDHLNDWRYEGIIFRKEQDPRNQKDGEPDEIPFIYDTKGRFPGGLNAPGIHALWAPDVSNSEGTGFGGHEFFEASSIRKINGIYYLIYSSVLSRELCYATSRYPDRDYKFGGTLIDICDVGIDGRTPEHAHNCSGNTHGSIENVLGQWYVFYHRQTNRSQYSRQGCAEPITIAEDGTIAQVPVTSCGLNGGPLRGEGTYPAAICCQLTGRDGIPFSDQIRMKWEYPFLTQDFADWEPEVENSSSIAKAEAEQTAEDTVTQYITNFTGGCTAGYKFFDFKAESSVCVLLRGRAHGILKITADDETGKNVCGEIPIRLYAEEWTWVDGTVRIPAGVHAVYFRYEGSGWLDIASFAFTI